MNAIRVHEPGGPEVLRYEELPAPQPGPGQALVRTEAIGVNFIDVYHRTGLYKVPLPFTPGSEGAGTVEEVGTGVSEVRPGDRVAWVGGPGAYAEKALVAAERLVPLPSGLSAEQAAAAALQGMTAHYLALSTYALKQGDTALVHAAAGGAGLLLTQVARMRGARVIGTVSTVEKAKLAKENGADEVVMYTEKDFEAEVQRLTGGRGVQVVYDSVGRTTFDKSLNCVAVRGTLALFGQSSGPVPPVDPARLAKNGIYLTRPSLFLYAASRDELLQRARDVFDWVASGRLKLLIHRRLPLAQAAEAHRLLESRQTVGKLLLLP